MYPINPTLPSPSPIKSRPNIHTPKANWSFPLFPSTEKNTIFQPFSLDREKRFLFRSILYAAIPKGVHPVTLNLISLLPDPIFISLPVPTHCIPAASANHSYFNDMERRTLENASLTMGGSPESSEFRREGLGKPSFFSRQNSYCFLESFVYQTLITRTFVIR